MNTSAIEATLQRLRDMAGAEGVPSPPAYGWFGFLDALGPSQEPNSPEHCRTPSTALSDLSASDSPPQSPRPTRPLYRHPHSRLRPPHHKPYYMEIASSRRQAQR